MLKSGKDRFKTDGLNSLKYDVLKKEYRRLYTRILVSFEEIEITWYLITFNYYYYYHCKLIKSFNSLKFASKSPAFMIISSHFKPMIHIEYVCLVDFKLVDTDRFNKFVPICCISLWALLSITKLF